jgi:hypothetical protein
LNSISIPSARRAADRTLIRRAIAALHRVARGTAVKSTPAASDGSSIRRAGATLHSVTRRAAVPASPVISVTVGRRRRVILSIRGPYAASDCCATQGTCQNNRCCRPHGKLPAR